jgi:uncharacterized membrane protein YagU involved in acid resistance
MNFLQIINAWNLHDGQMIFAQKDKIKCVQIMHIIFSCIIAGKYCL